jgi:hypothetical protein
LPCRRENSPQSLPTDIDWLALWGLPANPGQVTLRVRETFERRHRQLKINHEPILLQCNAPTSSDPGHDYWCPIERNASLIEPLGFESSRVGSPKGSFRETTDPPDIRVSFAGQEPAAPIHSRSSEALQNPNHRQRVLATVSQQGRFESFPRRWIEPTTDHLIPCETGFPTIRHFHVFISHISHQRGQNRLDRERSSELRVVNIPFHERP